MNKKGFTLVELLVVVSFVAIISASSTILLNNSLNKIKDTRYDKMVQEIKNAAEVYAYENEMSDDDSIKITIAALQGQGLLNYDLVDPRNNKKISSQAYVKITKNTETITYEYCDGNSCY